MTRSKRSRRRSNSPVYSSGYEASPSAMTMRECAAASIPRRSAAPYPTFIGTVMTRAPCAAAAAAQDVTHRRSQIRPEPLGQRGLKRRLRACDHLPREPRPYRLLEDPLPPPPAHLQTVRNAARELDHLSIEQRHAGLERVRHR